MVIKTTLGATSVATVILMLSPPMVAAQGDNGSALEAPREGDIYNYKKHQPTESIPTATTDRQVEDEINHLFRHSNELDYSDEGVLPGR
jgi:hypothetical protein